MGLHVKRLCLAVLVRSKLRTKCAYFIVLLFVYLVFLHLNLREPPRIPLMSPAKMAQPGLKPEDSYVNDQRPITADGNVRVIGDDISGRGVNRDSISANADNREIQNIRNGARRGGFLFVFRYYEQLGRATDNLMYLASLAKYKDRQVVAPFVNNSRMSGLPGGVSHSGRKRPSNFRFGTLDEYFDVSEVNNRLQSHGYSGLVDFQDFEVDCEKELDLVVHFLYAPVARNSAIEDVVSWFKLDHTAVKEIYRRTRENGGWDECSFLKKSKAAELLGFGVGRYVCVDPEVITSARELEERVFGGAKCIGIVQWKGMGEGRTHFPLLRSISQRLKPSDLTFNPQLVKIAKKFIQEHLGDNFIAVHVRTERHLVWKGINVTLRCIHKLGRRLREAQTLHKIPTLFLASDLTDHGSDTLVGDSKSGDRAHLSRALHKSLNFPTTFDPQETGIYDNGAAAIVEMNILAMATRLFTLGGGNFQEWTVDLFSVRNRGQTRVHRMCEIS